MAYIKNNQFVPELKTPSFVIPRVTVPRLQVPRLELPLKSLVPKQERKHVDDLGDILLGNPISGTLELRHTLRDAGLAEWEYVPIINRLIGAGLLIKERTVEPLLKGNIGEVFINTLDTAGKTMDIFANPIKSLFTGAGGGEPNSFAKSMGWVENAYREDYQWDTGFFLADLLLEILSDPTTYVSLGTNAVAKSTNAVQDTVKLTRTALSKKYSAKFVNELSDDTVEKLVKWISDDLSQKERSKIIEYVQNLFNYNEIQLQDVLKTTSKNGVSAKQLKALSNLHINHRDPRAIREFLDTIYDIRYTKPYKIYSTINKVRAAKETVDKALFIASAGLSPAMGVGALLMKHGITPMFKHLWHSVIKKKIGYNVASNFKRVTRSIEEAHQELAMKNRISRDVFKKFNNLFDKYNINSEKLQRIWVNIYNRTPNTANKLMVVQNEFLDRLVKAMPELKFILEDELKYNTPSESVIVKEFLDNYAQKNSAAIVADVIDREAVQELVTAITESSLVEVAYTEKILQNYKEVLEKEIRAFSTNIGKPLSETASLEQFDPIVNLLYVKKYVFHDDMSIENLLKVINNPDLNDSEKMFLDAILNFAGINADNITQVSTLLNKIEPLIDEASKNGTYKLIDIENIDDISKIDSSKTLTQFEVEDITPNYDVSALQHTYQVQKDTATTISKRLRSELKKDMNRLKRILIKGRTGSLLLAEDVKTTEQVIKDAVKDLSVQLGGLKSTLDNDKVVELFKKESKFPDLATLNNKQNSLESARIQLNKIYDEISAELDIPREQFNLLNKGDLLLNDANLRSILDDLDNLFDAGEDFQNKLTAPQISDTASESNSSILKRVLFFDLDKSTVTDLDDYVDAIQNLQKKVKAWVQQIKYLPGTNLEKQINKNTIQFIYTLNDVLNSTTMKEVTSNFIDVSNHFRNLYGLMVSARGRYNIINMELAAQMSNKNKKLFNAIGDPTSDARQHLESIIATLKSNINTIGAANNINEAIAVMNAHDFIAIYLDTQLTGYILPKEATDFLKGNMFNVIYNNGGEPIEYIQRHLDTITEHYLRDVDTFIKPMLDDSVSNLFNTDEWYETFRNEIGKNFKSALKQYHDSIGDLSKNLGVDLKVFNEYNAKSIAVFNELGLQYEDIIDALIQGNTNLAELETATDFITYVSGSNMNKAISSTQEIIKNYINSGDISKDYSKILNQFNELVNIKLSKNITEESLARTVTNAFREISRIDAWLAGDDTTLGKVLSGSKGNWKTLRNIISYMEVNKVNQYINDNTKLINVFGYSTAHPLLGFKKTPAAAFINGHKMNVANFKYTIDSARDSVEYNKLIANFEGAYRLTQDYAAKSFSRSEVYRDALSKFFLENELSWGPTNPKTYFLNPELSIDDLYAWDYLVMSGAMDKRINQSYIDIRKKAFKEAATTGNNIEFPKGVSLSEKYDYINSPIYLTDGIEQIANDNFVSDNAYDRYIDIVTGPQWEHLDAIIERDLETFMKDQTSMKQFEYIYTQYIKQDKDAMHKLRPIVQLEQDKRPIAKAIKDKQILEYLKSKGIKYMNDPKLQALAFRERTESLSSAIKNMTAIQLRSYIDANTPGFMIFVNDNPRDLLFQFTPDDLTDAGLIITRPQDAPDMWFIRRTNTDKVWVPYTYKKDASLIREIQNVVTKSFKDNQPYFNWGTIDVPEELFTGQMMNKTYLDVIKKHPVISTFLGNASVQKSYLKLDADGLDEFFTKEISRPNFTIVGAPNAFNRVLDYTEDTFREFNIEPWYYSTRLDRSAYAGSISAIKRVNTEHKYLQLWLNDDFAIGGSVFGPITKNATDEELSKMFRRNEYAAVVVKQDKNGMPHVYKIYIDNHKQLEAAVQQGAICVPHEVYRNMYLTINKHAIDNKLLRMYRQTIVGTFKSIYLTSVGYLMRNFIDSAVIKNASTTDGIAGMLDNFKYEYRALKDLEWYDNIQREVLDFARQETGTALFNRDYLQLILSKYSEEERSKYRLIDLFVNSAASGGPSKALSEYLIEYNMRQKPYEGYNWELWLNKTIQEGAYSPVRLIQNVNNKIEDASRYGLFLKILETQDNNVAQALKKVVETHFDYTLKDGGLDLLEQFFWFSTFPINNMFYYLNEGLLKNPDILKLQLDAMEQSYNNEEITWDDVRDSKYLTRNALTGNILFQLNGKNIVLKTGSSLFDLLNILLNPIGEAGERLNPFLSVLFGQEGLSELNPANAQFSRYKQIKEWFKTDGEQGSLIPSVYAKMYPERKYRTYYPTVYQQGKSNWNPKPRKTYLPKPRTYYLGLLRRPRYTRTRYSYLNKIKGPAGTTYAIGAQPDVMLDKEWKITASPIGYRYRDGIKKHIDVLKRYNISQRKKRH